MQKPSVGRVGHYIAPSPHPFAGAHCAAMVTAVDEDGSVTLAVYRPDGTQFQAVNPPYHEVGAITNHVDGPEGHMFGTWHWPERV